MSNEQMPSAENTIEQQVKGIVSELESNRLRKESLGGPIEVTADPVKLKESNELTLKTYEIARRFKALVEEYVSKFGLAGLFKDVCDSYKRVKNIGLVDLLRPAVDAAAKKAATADDFSRLLQEIDKIDIAVLRMHALADLRYRVGLAATKENTQDSEKLKALHAELMKREGLYTDDEGITKEWVIDNDPEPKE